MNKLNVGDKVKVKDSWFGHNGDIGTIVEYDGEPAYPFLVEFDVERQGVKEEFFNEESIELIEPEEETSTKFKVGDKVRIHKDLTAGTLIWERPDKPEPKDMTIEEIEKILGYSIRITN